MLALLTSLGVIRITGEKASEFLQGQLTCDINELPSLAAYCNLKGRVLSSMYITKHENQFFCIVHKSIIDLTIQTLNKYGVFSRVEITDISQQWQVYGSDKPSDVDIIIPVSDQRYLQISQQQVTPDTPELDWQRLDIEDGIAWITEATAEKFTPHMLNFPLLGAVSFNKGCYLGQEVVARTEHLGKVKRQIEKIKLDTTQNLKPGDALTYKEKDYTVINIAEYDLLAFPK